MRLVMCRTTVRLSRSARSLVVRSAARNGSFCCRPWSYAASLTRLSSFRLRRPMRIAKFEIGAMGCRTPEPEPLRQYRRSRDEPSRGASRTVVGSVAHGAAGFTPGSRCSSMACQSGSVPDGSRHRRTRPLCRSRGHLRRCPTGRSSARNAATEISADRQTPFGHTRSRSHAGSIPARARMQVSARASGRVQRLL